MDINSVSALLAMIGAPSYEHRFEFHPLGDRAFDLGRSRVAVMRVTLWPRRASVTSLLSSDSTERSTTVTSPNLYVTSKYLNDRGKGIYQDSL